MPIQAGNHGDGHGGEAQARREMCPRRDTTTPCTLADRCLPCVGRRLHLFQPLFWPAHCTFSVNWQIIPVTFPMGQGEPLNAIISGNSDPRVLKDIEMNGGLRNYFL